MSFARTHFGIYDIHPQESERFGLKQTSFKMFNTMGHLRLPMSRFLLPRAMIEGEEVEDDDVETGGAGKAGKDQSNCTWKRVHEEFWVKCKSSWLISRR